jgi:hypothetical protein
MREPARQRSGNLRIAKLLGPFGEVLVGVDHLASVLVVFGWQTEWQRAARFAEGR